MFTLVSIVGMTRDIMVSAGLFSIASIILFPVFYGAMGFVAGLITAFMYNVIAGWIGGIQIEIEQ